MANLVGVAVSLSSSVSVNASRTDGTGPKRGFVSSLRLLLSNTPKRIRNLFGRILSCFRSGAKRDLSQYTRLDCNDTQDHTLSSERDRILLTHLEKSIKDIGGASEWKEFSECVEHYVKTLFEDRVKFLASVMEKYVGASEQEEFLEFAKRHIKILSNGQTKFLKSVEHYVDASKQAEFLKHVEHYVDASERAKSKFLILVEQYIDASERAKFLESAEFYANAPKRKDFLELMECCSGASKREKFLELVKCCSGASKREKFLELVKCCSGASKREKFLKLVSYYTDDRKLQSLFKGTTLPPQEIENLKCIALKGLAQVYVVPEYSSFRSLLNKMFGPFLFKISKKNLFGPFLFKISKKNLSRGTYDEVVAQCLDINPVETMKAVDGLFFPQSFLSGRGQLDMFKRFERGKCKKSELALNMITAIAASGFKKVAIHEAVAQQLLKDEETKKQLALLKDRLNQQRMEAMKCLSAMLSALLENASPEEREQLNGIVGESTTSEEVRAFIREVLNSSQRKPN